MREFVLVSCSKTKRKETHRAADLYDPSPIFRKRVRFREYRDAPWGILSAKYGYLRPWDVVPTYDTHITERTPVWGAFVLDELCADLAYYDVAQVTILAGSKYVDPLVCELEARGYDVVDWNRGKRPGERMSALDEVVATDGGFIDHPPEPEPCPDCGYPVEACECASLFAGSRERYTVACENCDAVLDVFTEECSACGFDRRRFEGGDSVDD